MAQKMIPCKTCGEMIASNAKSCPHCGAKNKSKHPVLGAVLLVFGLLLFFSAFSGGGSSKTKSSQASNAPVLSEAEYKAQCQNADYESLSRDPDQYNGNPYTFHGKVIQVQEGSKNNVTLRISQDDGTAYSTDTWYVTYTRAEGESRILEDDIITAFGDFEGLYSYTSVLGQKITVPKMTMRYYELDKE